MTWLQVVRRQNAGQEGTLCEVNADRNEATTCHRCATVRADDGRAELSWVYEREPDGRERWLCPACARRHARDIEARITPEWW